MDTGRNLSIMTSAEVKNRRGVMGACAVGHAQSESRSETPHSVIKDPGFMLSNPSLQLKSYISVQKSYIFHKKTWNSL